ncbi:MAG: c-type cytochrome [bacterium]|nr:c-type cytochrome [bacterium]
MMSRVFPADASFNAVEADAAFQGLALISLAVMLLVAGLAVIYVIRFRRTAESQVGAGSGGINPVFFALWVLCAMGLAFLAGNMNLQGYLDRAVAPRDAQEIVVTARMWNWDFQYPNGEVTDSLHVAMGQPVKLIMQSDDVAHSLAIPALRLKQQVLPDRTSTTWFQADRPDTFSLRSHTFSGDGYGDMKAALIVHRPELYAEWVKSISDIFAGKTPVEVGEILYTTLSCKACHSLDGTRLVGPSLKDVYGNTFATVSGESVVVDDEYVRESILDPGVSIIDGYDAVMTPYRGRIEEREINAIIAWLKTISSHSGQEGN